MSGLTTTALKRVFTYNGIQLPDPGEVLTPDAVKDLFSGTYSELQTAIVSEPKYEGDSVIYEFIRAVRDKG